MRTRAPAVASVRVSAAYLFCTLLAVALLSAAAPPDPLLDAVKRNDVATVRSLLQSRKDPNTAQPDGLTALHLAAELGPVLEEQVVDGGVGLLLGVLPQEQRQQQCGQSHPRHHNTGRRPKRRVCQNPPPDAGLPESLRLD